MIIRFKLSNGIKFENNLSLKQLEQAEKTKQFKKANKVGIKNSYCYIYQAKAMEQGKVCLVFCSKKDKCYEHRNKKLTELSDYVNFLKQL